MANNQYDGGPGPRRNRDAASFKGLLREGSNLKRKRRPDFKVPTAGSVSPGDIYYAEPQELEVIGTGGTSIAPVQRKLGDPVGYSNEEQVELVQPETSFEVAYVEAATSPTPEQVAAFISGDGEVNSSNRHESIGESVGHADPERLEALFGKPQPHVTVTEDAMEDDKPDVVTESDDAGMIEDEPTTTEDDDSDG